MKINEIKFGGSPMSKILSISLLALALFAVTFAVNLQAPLYDAYAAESGVGVTAVAVAFAAYVGGLMPTLLLLGGLSDRIGRRIPIAAALLLGAAATALLALRPNWETLVSRAHFLAFPLGLRQLRAPLTWPKSWALIRPAGQR